MFEKYFFKCTKALVDIPFFHRECIYLTISKSIAGTSLLGNKYNTAERITQTVDDCKFSRENKYSTLKRMDDSHFYVARSDNLLQGLYGCITLAKQIDQ